jgi:hypothetical protein
MSNLPPALWNQKPERNVCLILEGLEEKCYFDKLKSLSVFSPKYKIIPLNAKGATKIPAMYQYYLAKDLYHIILIVCDMDRKPDRYNDIVRGVNEILGNDNASGIITFIRPCTLQIMLSHFGDVSLQTQAKPAAAPDVCRLTGVLNYQAHQNQLDDICRKINRRNWDDMLERLKLLSSNPHDMPSSNIKTLLENLCSNNMAWIDDINKMVFK